MVAKVILFMYMCIRYITSYVLLCVADVCCIPGELILVRV